jgi:GR25 family glycosyltransferase involved in LPS biosynthesis
MDRGLLEPTHSAMSPPVTLGEALPAGTGVCVINLDARTDRWTTFQETMLPLLAPLPVHRISATLGTALPGYAQPPYFRGRKRDRTWAARGGCTLSHRAAMLHALAQKWPYLLILEDDIYLPIQASSALLGTLQKSFASSPPEVFYLGYTDPVSPFKHLATLDESFSLYQLFGCSTTQAYLLSAAAVRHILAMLPAENKIWKWLTRHRAIDRFFYRNLSPELCVTAISPSLIEQSPGHSDILGKTTEEHSQDFLTAIPTAAPHSAASFEKAMAARRSTFARSAIYDLLRSSWKSLRGF